MATHAAALGLSALAGLVAVARDGIVVVDADRRCVYANSAACEMLGGSIAALYGSDFLDSFIVRERDSLRDRFSQQFASEQFAESMAWISCTVVRPDGNEREIEMSASSIDISGGPHRVAILRDLTVPHAAARTAVALAQTAGQLVRTRNTEEILDVMARHAVEATRALACRISVIDGDGRLTTSGDYGVPDAATPVATFDIIGLVDIPGGDLILEGKPVIRPDMRVALEANPDTAEYAATLRELDWQAGVSLPLSWEDKVFGVFRVYLPSGLTGPSDVELSFYAALADQASVAVTNARLVSEGREASVVLERARLARELHDSVSQALFSMTMHARSAQVLMDRAGLDQDAPLGRSIAQLAELTRGALAEMRALIFELRPGALSEEGLVAALSKQAAALSAREQAAFSVDGPERRLELPTDVEEHLYRIVLEALHNVVKHAGAANASVTVRCGAGAVGVTVRDDGVGFDPTVERPGHLGLSTMAERAAIIGADLTLTSAPGAGTSLELVLAVERRA